VDPVVRPKLQEVNSTSLSSLGDIFYEYIMSRTTNYYEFIIEQAKIAASLANTAQELRQALDVLFSALF
jgi:translation elongation factor EF-G